MALGFVIAESVKCGLSVPPQSPAKQLLWELHPEGNPVPIRGTPIPNFPDLCDFV